MPDLSGGVVREVPAASPRAPILSAPTAALTVEIASANPVPSELSPPSRTVALHQVCSGS